MKQPVGNPRARRTAPQKPVQLNLRRARVEEEDEIGDRQGNFWKWFALIFLLHVVAFVILALVMSGHPKPPPVDLISLVAPGDIAKGTPGEQSAPKLGPTTAAPKHTKSATPPEPVEPTPPPPKPVQPKVEQVVKPEPVKPPPIIKDNAPPITPVVKPVVKPKPKPVKVKVDLTHLVDTPDNAEPEPKPAPPVKLKPKPHPKKVVRPPDDSPSTAAAPDPETDGLSEEQVAKKLGSKLKAAGVEKGLKSGPSGDPHGKANSFGDFYASVRDQVMNKWICPNISDTTATDPVVQIHVEKDGRVTPGSPIILHSSGNQAVDDSALATARSMGYTLQPLPDGCPPDISITFNLPR